MFPWICPECGHECAPTDMECLVCNPAAVPVATLAAAHAVGGGTASISVAVLDRAEDHHVGLNGGTNGSSAPMSRVETPAPVARVAAPEAPVFTPGPTILPPVVAPEPITLHVAEPRTVEPEPVKIPIAEPAVVAEPVVEPVQAVVAQPEEAAPVVVEPVAAEPVEVAPVAAAVQEVAPVAAEPAVVEPAVADVEEVARVAAEPVVADSLAAEVEEVAPVAAEAVIVEPVIADSTESPAAVVAADVPEPIVVEPAEAKVADAVEPVAAEPVVVEPEVIELVPAEPEAVVVAAVEPIVAEPEAVAVAAVEPLTVEPATVEPEAVEPPAVEVPEPVVVEPAVAEDVVEEPVAAPLEIPAELPVVAEEPAPVEAAAILPIPGEELAVEPPPSVEVVAEVVEAPVVELPVEPAAPEAPAVEDPWEAAMASLTVPAAEPEEPVDLISALMAEFASTNPEPVQASPSADVSAVATTPEAVVELPAPALEAVVAEPETVQPAPPVAEPVPPVMAALPTTIHPSEPSDILFLGSVLAEPIDSEIGVAAPEMPLLAGNWPPLPAEPMTAAAVAVVVEEAVSAPTTESLVMDLPPLEPEPVAPAASAWTLTEPAAPQAAHAHWPWMLDAEPASEPMATGAFAAMTIETPVETAPAVTSAWSKEPEAAAIPAVSAAEEIVALSRAVEGLAVAEPAVAEAAVEPVPEAVVEPAAVEAAIPVEAPSGELVVAELVAETEEETEWLPDSAFLWDTEVADSELAVVTDSDPTADFAVGSSFASSEDLSFEDALASLSAEHPVFAAVPDPEVSPEADTVEVPIIREAAVELAETPEPVIEPAAAIAAEPVVQAAPVKEPAAPSEEVVVEAAPAVETAPAAEVAEPVFESVPAAEVEPVVEAPVFADLLFAELERADQDAATESVPMPSEPPAVVAETAAVEPEPVIEPIQEQPDPIEAFLALNRVEPVAAPAPVEPEPEAIPEAPQVASVAEQTMVIEPLYMAHTIPNQTMVIEPLYVAPKPKESVEIPEAPATALPPAIEPMATIPMPELPVAAAPEDVPALPVAATPAVEPAPVISEPEPEPLGADLFAALSKLSESEEAVPPALPVEAAMEPEPESPKLLDPKAFLTPAEPEAAVNLPYMTAPPVIGANEPPIYVGDRWESPYELAERLKNQAEQSVAAPPPLAAPPDPFAEALKGLDTGIGTRNAEVKQPAAPPPMPPMGLMDEPSVLLAPEPMPQLPSDHWSLRGGAEPPVAQNPLPVSAAATTLEAKAAETPLPKPAPEEPKAPAAETKEPEPPKKATSTTVKLAAIAVTVALGCMISWMMFGNNAPSAAPENSAASNYEGGVAALPIRPNRIAKDLELVGFRMKEAGAEKAQVKFIVVNHSSALISELKMELTIKAPKAKPAARNFSEFLVEVPSLGPFESSEVTVTVKTPSTLKDFDYPEWSQLRPEFRVVSPQ